MPATFMIETFLMSLFVANEPMYELGRIYKYLKKAITDNPIAKKIDGLWSGLKYENNTNPRK